MVRTGAQHGSLRPWIGVNSLEEDGRIKVMQVNEESPADRAGIVAGDIILAVNGESVDSLENFYGKLWGHNARPGNDVRLAVLHGVKLKEVTVRSIDRRNNPFAAGQRTKFFGWQHNSGERADVAEEQNSGARSNGVAEQIQHLRRIFYRPRQRDLLYDDAIALGPQVPRMLASGMLLVGHERFVAGLQIDAVRYVAVGLGGIS